MKNSYMLKIEDIDYYEDPNNLFLLHLLKTLDKYFRSHHSQGKWTFKTKRALNSFEVSNYFYKLTGKRVTSYIRTEIRRRK